MNKTTCKLKNLSLILAGIWGASLLAETHTVTVPNCFSDNLPLVETGVYTVDFDHTSLQADEMVYIMNLSKNKSVAWTKIEWTNNSSAPIRMLIGFKTLNYIEQTNPQLFASLTEADKLQITETYEKNGLKELSKIALLDIEKISCHYESFPTLDPALIGTTIESLKDDADSGIITLEDGFWTRYECTEKESTE